jgi:hypothetical protein
MKSINYRRAPRDTEQSTIEHREAMPSAIPTPLKRPLERRSPCELVCGTCVLCRRLLVTSGS